MTKAGNRHVRWMTAAGPRRRGHGPERRGHKGHAERMQGLQQSMTHHLGTIAHIQTMVEYIEIFLVSVYAAHLWDMIEPKIHSNWLHHAEWSIPLGPLGVWRMPPGSWGVLLIALVAGGITALCIKLRRRSQHRTGDHAAVDQSH
jgi:hypothetical protein